MQQSKTDLYNALDNDDKNVLKIAALHGHCSLQELTLMAVNKYTVPVKKINALLKTATTSGFLTKETRYSDVYIADFELMIHVYPELGEFEVEFEKISNRKKDEYYRYSYTPSLVNTVKYLQKLLFALLFESPEKYKNAEKAYMENVKDYSILFKIIENSAYRHVIQKISHSVLEQLLYITFNVDFLGLKPFSGYKVLLACIPQEFPRHPQPIELLLKGEIQEAIDCIHVSIEYTSSEYAAIKHVISGEYRSAVEAFERSLKIKRRDIKTAHFPNSLLAAFYYLVALINTDSTMTFVKLQKIKGGDYESYVIYLPVIYNALNDLEDKRYSVSGIIKMIEIRREIHYNVLHVFLSCYLSASEFPKSLLPLIEITIQQAVESEFNILAYEAAFAYNNLVKTEISENLFRKIAAKMSYPPVLSTIKYQEDWEKSLNMLDGIKSSKTGKNNSVQTTRVAYFFQPRNMKIQPVLQTLSPNGTWTAGRNIALKNFIDCKPEAMTDKDVNIAKTMTIDGYNYGYDNGNKGIFKHLIGHSYVFLENTANIPVEFVAARPLVSIKNTNGNYVVKVEDFKDLDQLEDDIHISKETNTRYKVLSLTLRQKEIAAILLKKPIVVPKAGKERLMDILAFFSSENMEIHSDLQAVTGENTKIENRISDSNIRVQLLPFGNGLKAELFCKPFGNTPPYCKPGKGGKIMLQHVDDNTQIQVKRDFVTEIEYENRLMNEIQNLESVNINNDGLIAFDNPADSLYLLDILNKHQDVCIIEWPEGERYKIRGTSSFKNLNITIKSGTNWFDLEGELKVDENTVISLQQLIALTAKGHGRFIELSSGEFIALTEEFKKRLDDLRMFGSIDKKSFRINKFASVALDDFFENVDDLKSDKAWKDFTKTVFAADAEDIQIPKNLQAELRPYQEEGFRWLARLAAWEGGACLADDMGLGKTIQALAILLHRAHLGPSLVVCPVSVIGNWINEINRFAPSLQFKTLGVVTAREQIINGLQAGEVLITSYGLLQSEEELFSRPVFASVVLDEAHTIKNYATKTSKATMNLQASFRLALTGTPVQNYMSEIWNLFNFINPGLLGSLQHFTNTFVKTDDEAAHKRLKKLISPFILRRTKSKVLDELPPKTEIIKKIAMSDEETAFYELIRREAMESLKDAGENEGAAHIRILAEITKLRQACCNPLLVNPKIKIESSKLNTFLGIVDELINNNHRALVFSQFVTHLSLVRESLDRKKITYRYLDGSTSQSEREKRVKAFQEGNDSLFLISLKAGGLGLNLTAADYVIHLDPWWNPAIEDQASDRAHRIGQTRPVTIYRLVAENTIEEKIIRLHNTKRDLAESLLEGSDKSARLSLTELIELIKG